jgi:hypothetical protein
MGFIASGKTLPEATAAETRAAAFCAGAAGFPRQGEIREAIERSIEERLRLTMGMKLPTGTVDEEGDGRERGKLW